MPHAHRGSAGVHARFPLSTGFASAARLRAVKTARQQSCCGKVLHACKGSIKLDEQECSGHCFLIPETCMDSSMLAQKLVQY
ncbi:hypothetical protein BST61_g5798 [Cercospora zeina]